MSHKHKRRIDDDKRPSSRVNVFERLGDSRKDRGNWPVHPPQKSNRSTVERYEGNHGGRMPDRWPSSNRDRQVPMQQTSPTKLMKSKKIDYVENYKQDRHRYEDQIRAPKPRHHVVETLPPKHHQSSIEVVQDDYDRKRKRKPISPASVSGSSVSPLRTKREHKRSKYQSPSPPPQIFKEKEHRGRSKERKTKKVKEITKVKDHQKTSKSTKSYEQYPGTSEYKASHHQYEEMQEESHERVKYHKEVYLEHHKEKKRVPQTSSSPIKKSRAMPKDIDSSENEERRNYRDSSGKSSQSRKAAKAEPVYEPEDVTSHRKKTKSKVEPVLTEEPKRKKKVKAGREEHDTVRYSSKGSSSDYTPREKGKKPKEDVYYEDVRVSQSSSKRKDLKYTASDVDSVEEPERKTKLKKKKKQVIEELPPEPIKKKKNKQKIVEEPIKKKSSKIYEEESREKPKTVKKKKRPREPTSSPSSSSSNTSSDSESENESVARSKKHYHSSRDSWEAENAPDASPERTYSKRSSYGSGRDRSIPAEVGPKRKRTKLETSQRGSVELENASRYRHTSPDRTQYTKRSDNLTYERQSYTSYEKESKRIREDESRDDRRMRSSDIPQKRHDRPPDYMDRKEEPPVARYDRSPVNDPRYTKRHPEEKFYDKNYSRYDDNPSNTSFEEKRSYPRRDQVFHDKKSSYDDRRDNRGDSYSVEERKRDPYPTPHPSKHLHPKSSTYSHDPRSGDMRSMKEPRHSDWQMERMKKHRDPVSGYSGGLQHTSSWGEGRETSRVRMEGGGHRGNQHPPRIEERNYRMPRSDSRTTRNEVQEMRSGRPDSRERPQIRDPSRKQEKWVPERRPYVNQEMSRRGETRYSDGRGKSQENLQEQRAASPSFYREVRRSGESRHNDLKIEVTIGGSSSGQDYERNRTVKRSPLRKVSSYDLSKSRDRDVARMQTERNSSQSHDHGNVDMSYKRPMSSHSKQGSSKYQQHGSREFSGSSRDYSDNREYSRNHMEPKSLDHNKVRKKDDKYYKKDSAHSEDDRSRGSSTVERVRSRDSSAVGRDRSRDNRSRQSSRDRSRRDPSHSDTRSGHSSRKPKSHKETSKDASERRRKRTETSDKKSTKESEVKEERKAAPEAAGVLDVDWTEISTEKKGANQLDSNSILNRFKPGSVLLRMGVSSKLLPPDLLEDVKKTCQNEVSLKDDVPLVLNRELGALNRAESLRQWSWSNAFTSQTSRLTSYADAEHRKRILSVTQNMLYPPQPPVIINAKSYASSIKHYLNKTKLAVGGA